MPIQEETQKGQKARVTIVVSHRERFGLAKQSLDSIYESTDIPFELVYIDARSPAWLSEWLDQESAKRGFRIVRRDRFVTPNEARNLGAAVADTEFVAFVDNDVFYSPNWLGALLDAADDTGAEIITPLTCEGLPVHTKVHHVTSHFSHDNAAFFATPHGVAMAQAPELLAAGELRDDLSKAFADLRGAIKAGRGRVNY